MSARWGVIIPTLMCGSSIFNPAALTWNQLSKIWQMRTELPDTGCWGGLCLLAHVDMILTLAFLGLLCLLLLLLLLLLLASRSRACHDSGAPLLTKTEECRRMRAISNTTIVAVESWKGRLMNLLLKLISVFI